MENSLSFETIVLVVFSFSLLAVILGVVVSGYWIHKKLDRILSLPAFKDSDYQGKVSEAGNKGQDDFPNSSHTARLNKGHKHNACDKNNYDRDESASHSNNIAELLPPKQPRFSRTAPSVSLA